MLTITDLFCGAGGSSSGAIQVPGVRVRMAANHWKLAVETHNTNHPDADHAAVDLHEENPRYFPRTDILWASPECTKWSQAGGSKSKPAIEEGLFEDPLSDDAATRSRLLMFDVLRFAEHHRYRAIVVENVVDIATQPRYRLAWQVWREQLAALGYRFKVVSLNSMHAQALGPAAPQSRDRLYVVAWRRGERAPDLARFQRPRAWCPRCDAIVEAEQAWKPGRTVGRYRQQYVYVHGACGQAVEPQVLPAAAAIDWTLPGERIGDRLKPLAEKTLARIEAGLRRYAGAPFVTNHRGSADQQRTVPLGGPLPTLTASGNHLGSVVPPMLVPAGGTWNDAAASVAEPFRTRTTRDTEALVVPLRNNGVARPAGSHPVPTVAAAGNHHALVMRNMTARGDQGQMSTPVNEPIRTQTASSVQSLIRWDHLVYAFDTGRLRTVDRPLPTQTTVEGDAVVNPSIAVDDCTFRMLEPHEIQLAMAFGADYRVLGNKRERVRQLGNAVTPPAARDLIAAVVEALGGEAVAR
ncbi:DNA cytosine methyltransferase [Micromonospora sp. NPDC049048]|uniref:DNA cytosine methyltransferase n=1 Tax=Micromonospora sp. NPDC049048 TaxID=3364263 RepID=UPI00371BA14B